MKKGFMLLGKHMQLYGKGWSKRERLNIIAQARG